MTTRFTITERARKHVREARAWYEAQARTLGDQLVDEVFETIDTIVQRPTSFPEVKPGVRGARCDRFPYKIYYRIRANGIRVLAVYHLRRDPDRWDDPNR